MCIRDSLNIGLSGGLNTQTVTADFMKQDGVNLLGFATTPEPADENNWGFKNKLDPSKPVSYTHLDVYKRQVWASSFVLPVRN